MNNGEMSSENSLYGGNWAVHAITNHSSASYAWHDTEIHRFKVVYIKKNDCLKNERNSCHSTKTTSLHCVQLYFFTFRELHQASPDCAVGV